MPPQDRSSQTPTTASTSTYSLGRAPAVRARIVSTRHERRDERPLGRDQSVAVPRNGADFTGTERNGTEFLGINGTEPEWRNRNFYKPFQRYYLLLSMAPPMESPFFVFVSLSQSAPLSPTHPRGPTHIYPHSPPIAPIVHHTSRPAAVVLVVEVGLWCL